MNNLRTSPYVPAPPPIFYGAFAPSFMWRRRPCSSKQPHVAAAVDRQDTDTRALHRPGTAYGSSVKDDSQRRNATIRGLPSLS